MKELHAGYVTGAVWKAIQEQQLSDDLDWLDVVRRLSHFVIDRDLRAGDDKSPVLAVLANILGRGLPTLPSLYLEKKIQRLTNLIHFGVTGKKEVSSYACDFEPHTREALIPLLERAFCIVSPPAALAPSPGYEFPDFGSDDNNTDFDSDAEETFWNGPLSDLIGSGGMQLALRQRGLHTIAGRQFDGQRVDIAVELPGSRMGQLPKGIVFEVDGPHHGQAASRTNDNRRDNGCVAVGWSQTYRHRLWQGKAAGEPIDVKDRSISALLTHPYFRRIRENISHPLVKDDLGSRVRLLALFPFAVARIQRAILEFVLSGTLSLDATVWDIIVVDRDDLRGCGITAGRDLRMWIRQLWKIYRPGEPVPIIRVEEISADSTKRVQGRHAQAVIDISVEMRYGVTLPDPPALFDLPSLPRLVVRSGYFPLQGKRKLEFGDPLIPAIADGPLEHTLTFFLRNIFRKVDFRPKQVEIIARALRNESVIALLPTGAGKSITYQLPAMLQNGVVIVVDPIKSLMKDQDDNLKAIGISASTFINSMTTTRERRDNTRQLTMGVFKFAFVSPERFIIREFRDALVQMGSEGRVYCAYVVVDEAHCVSEWGHDFRTAYLRLGANARKFCPHRTKVLPLLALTGTASYEVLDDIHIELGHQPGDNISVRPDSMERANLKYRVVQLDPLPQVPLNSSGYLVSRTVGEAKQSQLPKITADIAEQIDLGTFSSFITEHKGSGLIFCPHARWLHGAQEVLSTLRQAYPDVSDTFGVYYGSSEENGRDAAFDPVQTQDDFKRGKLKVLACTKAFGMGIDKPDVRFTLHYNIPPSLESFYQEAGRAGRDGEDAQCWILHGGVKSPREQQSVDFLINDSFHRNTFPGASIEESKVFELLDQNRLPGSSPIRLISTMLYDETGIDFSLGLFHPADSTLYRIYINHPQHRDAKVFVNVPDGQQLSVGANNGFPNYQAVAQLVIDWLNEKKDPHLGWRDWLFSIGETSVEPGIEELLATHSTSGPFPIVISFENAYLEEIALRLSRKAEDVKDAFQYAESADAFIAKLGKGTKLDESEKHWVENTFLKIRLREHTFRAIYRLTLLGAVEDFEADYASASLTVWIHALPSGGYTERLRKYIQAYAPMDVAMYLTIADQADQSTELRRCLHSLIAFVYARIAKQRQVALRTMEQTTVRGIANASEFTDAVTYFFDSAYLPILRPYLNEYTPELVFEICLDTGAAGAKLAHLLGACNRLLQENPDNGAFHALRTFAIALLGYSDGDVRDEVDAALESFKKYWNWNRIESHQFLLRLRAQIIAIDSDRAGGVDASIISDHSRWFANFNGTQQPGPTRSQPS